MPAVKLMDGRTVDTDRLPVGVKVKYGRPFRPGFTHLQIELAGFRENWLPPFGLGRLGHLRKFISIVWPNYQWNEWSQKKFQALCMFDLASFMGCAGSGKSRDLAMYALAVWWSAPMDTAVAVTSTDIEGAKGRVWGHIITAHQEAQWLDDDGVVGRAPGKVTDQPPKVRLAGPDDGVRGAGQQSIQLVAAGNQFTDAALKTLQGLHNRFVLLILDELQDLTPGIIGSVLENLTRNPRFQLCAAGNISGPDDPLANLSRPVTPENRGYDDVNEETESWAIERAGLRGICVRFDAEHSPNFERTKAGLPEFDFLPRVWEVNQKREALERGEVDITDYYRQWKAFIAPKNAEDGRYSAAAILKFHAGDKVLRWASKEGFVTLGGCDPAYTSGGDRFIFYPVRYGLSDAGIWTLEFQVPFSLQHDLTDSDLRNFAMVRQTIRLCKEAGIEPRNFGVDISGENPIGDIFANEWGNNEFLRVNFQGAASERRVSLTDKRPCKDEYANKCAELWCTGAIFMRHDQIRGLNPQHQKELSARKVIRGTRNRLVVETKKEMKRRTAFSPDVADGGNIGIEVARERHGAIAGAENLAAVQKTWQEVAKKSNVVPIRLSANRGISRVGRRF